MTRLVYEMEPVVIEGMSFSIYVKDQQLNTEKYFESVHFQLEVF